MFLKMFSYKKNCYTFLKNSSNEIYLLFMFSVSKIYMIFTRVGLLDVFNGGGRVMFLPTELGKIS